MSSRITITANFAPLAQLKLSSRELMKEIGLLARERIIRRTVAGRDEHEAAFRPYSPEYRAVKAKELGAGTVNLQVSGAMLGAIILTEVTEKSVSLGFSS